MRMKRSDAATQRRSGVGGVPIQNSAPIWPQWLGLTRLLFSAQIAFSSELSRWAATEIDDEHGIRLRDRSYGSKYKVTLDQHLATLNDLNTFYGIILLRAYSLMEFHGKYINYIIKTNDYDLIQRIPTNAELQAIQEIALVGGIEGWGNALLKSVNRDWKIIDGKFGLVQVSIIRNAVAHGYSAFTQGLHDNAIGRGTTLPYAVGQLRKEEWYRDR